VTTVVTDDVAQAAAILRRGGLVAFPTETVYGLGANALDAAAVRRVFAAKGRPADNPLIVHLADPDEAARVARVTPLARRLAARFWPGPLTLVLPSRGVVPEAVRAGLPTVAVRCPDHELARSLIRLTGSPLAAPSANRSGRPSPTAARAVLDDLDGRIDAVLDGGRCRHGIESTVVDCTGAEPRLLRLGALPAEALGLAPRVDARAAGRSPGTRHRHYAPSVPLYLVGDLAAALEAHPEASVVCGAEDAARLGARPDAAVHVFAASAAGRAAELFAVLRRLERLGRPIVVAALPEAGLDAATMDRLRRASAASREELPPDA
jgi:L-threonylcarbamoyladenylate synthase